MIREWRGVALLAAFLAMAASFVRVMLSPPPNQAVLDAIARGYESAPDVTVEIAAGGAPPSPGAVEADGSGAVDLSSRRGPSTEFVPSRTAFEHLPVAPANARSSAQRRRGAERF